MVILTFNQKQPSNSEFCPAETSTTYLSFNLNTIKFQKGLSALILLFALLFTSDASMAATITSTTTGGDWATGSTWSGGTAPSSSDDVVIASGAAITLSANASCNSLTFTAGTAGASLTINSTNTLTVAANITMNGTTATTGTARTSLNIGAGSVSCVNLSMVVASANAGSSSRTTAVLISTGVLTTTGNITVNRAITGASGITFSSNGTVNVAGTFMSTNAGSFTASTGTVNYNGAAQNVSTYTYYNLTLSGSGTKTLLAATTATGLLTTSVTLNMANRNLTVGSLTGTGNLTHSTGTAGNITLTIGSDNTSPAAYSGILSNGTATSVLLTKSGTGTLILSGANTYTGATSISGGKLKLGSTTALGISSAITVSSGAVLDLNGFTLSTARPLTLNGTGLTASPAGALTNTGDNASYSGAITLGSASTITASSSGTLTVSGTVGTGAFALTLNGAAGTGTMSGVISTPTSVIKNGAGTWVLSGVNTYTGVTTISAGVLSVGTIGNGGTAGNIGQASNAAANLVLDGGTLFYTGSNASTDRNITLTAAKTSTIDINTSTLEITGAIANTSGALTKTGAGTLTLSGTNLYTGATIINNGTLRVNNTAAFGSTAGGVTVTSPGQIDLFGKTYSTETLSLAGAGPDGNGSLVNTSSGTTAAYNGAITITDATTIGGDISAANNITLGGTVTGAFTLTKMGGATLDLGTNAVSISGLNISEGTVKSTTGTLTVTGVFTDDGTFTHNGGTVAFTGTSSITGTVTTTFNNLTITSGTLTAPSGTINIAGNYSNSGTFTHNGGTVNFNGGAQSIGGAGSAATTFNNLTISGTLTKTLTKPVTVAGNLTLTNGYLATDATNILTIAAGGSTSGVSSSSFVNGPMAKTGNTAFDFPVGAGTKLGRIGISAPSTTTTFTAQYFSAAPSNSAALGNGLNGGGGKISTVEYWDLTPTGTPSAKVILHWESNASGITSLQGANLVVAHYTGSAWVSEGNAGTTVSGAAGTLTSNTVSTWSPFTFGSPTSLSPLPVKLISFNAKAIEKDGVLNWSTATERNNDHFDIERSNDGVNFTKIGAVNGAGNSTTIEKYTFTDTRVADIGSQNVYYRLKQIDFDGSFEYSNIANITFEKQGLVSISNVQPNPFVGNLAVNFNLPEQGIVTIQIIDAQGRIVASNEVNANKGANITEFNTADYAKGLYFISVNYKGSSTNYKMLVKE